MKILIGYDGSDCAKAALHDLVRAGLPQKANTIVMSVAELWLPPPQSLAGIKAGELQIPEEPAYARARAKAEETVNHAREGQNRLKTIFPGWEVTSESAFGSPAWEIVAKADQWKPNLIVVGSHGRSALGRFVLGSVAQRVLTEAHCSVRVARSSDAAEIPLRILVGLDGSPGCKAVVEEIARRFWPKATEFRLIVANDPLAPAFIGEFVAPVAKTLAETNLAERQWIEKILGDAASILRSAGLVASTDIQDGDPKRVLIDQAQEWGAACIFVGSTGFSNRLERFVLGSVSASVATRAHCSVEVVR